jgi:6-phosphogluconolactonase
VKPFELITFSDADELARTVAGAWLDKIAAAERSGREHHMALSGGRIAQKFFAAAVEQAKARSLSLGGAHFFWADERCVPPDDTESNFRVARDFLLSPLGVAETRVHRVHGEDSPETAALEAEKEIRRIVPLNHAGQPVLDLVLLGMGEDGHVASLFPGESDRLKSNRAIYRAIRNSPKPPSGRVTLGYPAIAAANEVWVLVSGAGKENALRDSLAAAGRTPLAQVLKLRRQTRILTDLRM